MTGTRKTKQFSVRTEQNRSIDATIRFGSCEAGERVVSSVLEEKLDDNVTDDAIQSWRNFNGLSGFEPPNTLHQALQSINFDLFVLDIQADISVMKDIMQLR